MSKIKVTVKNTDQANELIGFWKDKDVDLEISVKENTTAANSDVRFVVNTDRLKELIIRKKI